MKEQPTTELLDILNNIDKKDMSAYIKEFAATASAAAPFPEYIAEHSIAIADVVHRCRGILSKSYVYDILNGSKRIRPAMLFCSYVSPSMQIASRQDGCLKNMVTAIYMQKIQEISLLRPISTTKNMT